MRDSTDSSLMGRCGMAKTKWSNQTKLIAQMYLLSSPWEKAAAIFFASNGSCLLSLYYSSINIKTHLMMMRYSITCGNWKFSHSGLGSKLMRTNFRWLCTWQGLQGRAVHDFLQHGRDVHQDAGRVLVRWQGLQ